MGTHRIPGPQHRVTQWPGVLYRLFGVLESQQGVRNVGSYAAGDVVRAFAELSYDGQIQFGNVFHWQVDGGATGGTDDAFAAAALAWLETVYTNFKGPMVDNAKFEQVTFYNVTQDRPAGVYAWPTLVDGDSTGNALPEGVAALVVLYTDVKRVIGKKYFGGIGTVALDDRVWDGSLQLAMQGAGSAMLSPFTVGAADAVVHGIYRRSLGTFVQLRSYAIRALPAYQRRRKPGVGS